MARARRPPTRAPDRAVFIGLFVADIILSIINDNNRIPFLSTNRGFTRRRFNDSISWHRFLDFGRLFRDCLWGWRGRDDIMNGTYTDNGQDKSREQSRYEAGDSVLHGEINRKSFHYAFGAGCCVKYNTCS
eukprot:CCRYP_007015-RA/>CCRYP_007015-RA protein AED:0.48 eAED:0.52 QI:0/0/0/1/0/0/2/0/130